MAVRRHTLMFSAAVLVALGATYGVYRVLEQAKEAAHVATQPVVIAAQDVQEGERFERLSIAVAQWPAPAAPADAYAVPDSVVGRVARVAVFKGEPIVPGRLAPAGTGPGLEVKITSGKRAMAVKINDVVGLAGLIQPNSRVDVLVTLKEEGSQDRQRAKLFMDNVRVLSVGTQVERGEDGKAINATTAALEVSPDEAERLAVAMNQGTIQLVLRGYGDPDSVRTPGANSNDVLTQLHTPVERPAPAVVPAVARPARHAVPVVRAAAPPTSPPPATASMAPPRRPDSLIVEVYRGTKLVEQTFQRRDSASTAATP